MIETTSSLLQNSVDLIATRAKARLRQIMPPGPSLAEGESIVDQTIKSLAIVHDYYMEQARHREESCAFVLEQMHDLVASLINQPTGPT